MQTFPCNYSWHVTVWSYKTKSYSWITDLLYKRCCYWHNSLAYGISVSVIKVVACTKAVKNSINVCKCKDTFHLFLLWAFFFFPCSMYTWISNELCHWTFCPLPIPLSYVLSYLFLWNYASDAGCTIKHLQSSHAGLWRCTGEWDSV